MHTVKLMLSELNAMWAKLHSFTNYFFNPQTKWKVKVKENSSQANVIGKETMHKLIQDSNQYLKNTTSVPIYGIPKAALLTEIVIDNKVDKKTKFAQ